MSPQEKKEYNKNYYNQHKDYWSEYYSKGKTVGRGGSLIDENEFYKNYNETSDRINNTRKELDAEIAKEQKKQQELRKKMEEDANKDTSTLFKEQITEAHKFMDSKEFKQQMKEAVTFLKDNYKEMIGMAMHFAKSFFGALKG